MSTAKKAATTAKRKGRPKTISSPEMMEKLFIDYKTAIKKKPIKQHDYVGGMGKSVQRKKERPLTMEGFENYCWEKKIIADLKRYFANTDNAYDDYRPICTRIKQIIRQDQIEGGMAGIYNPSITQRLNNLVEKSETTVVEQPLFPEQSK